MNRRGFLGSLATAAAALVLDPERALWVPGAKKIFIPSPKPVERIPVGVDLRNGMLVFSDQVTLTESSAAILGTGPFRDDEYRFAYDKNGQYFWIQTKGQSRIYALSLAS